MKKIGYILLVGIVSIMCYGVYGERAYTPLEKKDFECLSDYVSADVIHHKDFIGWSHGDYFELFVYRITNVKIDLSYPIINRTWEHTILPDTTETMTWSNCPMDSIIELKYEHELTWIMNSKRDEAKTIQCELKDENNYYSFIYVSELQKYFLLYNPSKGVLYYMRQNGF